MTEVAGEYAGLKPKQARTKIIEDLETAGFVEKLRILCTELQFQKEVKFLLKSFQWKNIILNKKKKLEK